MIGDGFGGSVKTPFGTLLNAVADDRVRRTLAVAALDKIFTVARDREARD